MLETSVEGSILSLSRWIRKRPILLETHDEQDGARGSSFPRDAGHEIVRRTAIKQARHNKLAERRTGATLVEGLGLATAHLRSYIMASVLGGRCHVGVGSHCYCFIPISAGCVCARGKAHRVIDWQSRV